jgi:PAS domain S-box-containing protein
MSDPGGVNGFSPEASFSLLKTIFATSGDAIAIALGDVFVAANGAAAELFGYDDPAELSGVPIAALIAESSQLLFAEIFRRRSEGREAPTSYTIQIVRRDGVERTVDVRSTSCSVDGALHTLVMIREAPPALPAIRGEDFYRAVFEVNTAVKLLIDPTTGSIVDANRAACEFYGWPLATLRSMHLTDINLLTPEEIAKEMEAARTLRRGYFRFRHRVASGEVRHVEVHSGPVVIGGDTLLLSILFDVTERDVLEEELRRVQRLEAVGRLAGGVAHDFNNLLTVMLTCASVITRRVPPADPIRPYVDDLTHAATRAAELTRELLAFSRRQVLKPAAVDLNALVERMQGLLRRTLGPGFDVIAELDESIPPAHADPSQLDHVVMNLALNARDAMPSGGTLTLSTGVTEVASGGSVSPGRWVTLTAADTGLGMDEGTRARVFEPFFTTKDFGRGTGLGLSTVYGIVTQTGGHITVESEEGHGTRFIVYLPLHHRPERVDAAYVSGADGCRPSAAHDEEVDPAAPGGSRVILLVDDLTEVREALAASLRSSGFIVCTASSAEEALRLPDEALDGVDVVVSDVAMPGLSGLDLVERLRVRRPRLRVLLISGALRDQEQKLPQPIRFLQKPFSGDKLARAVLELLGDASE